MMDVLITFDTEFSIGGAITYPEKYSPLGGDYVWMPKGNDSLGLGYILKVLDEYNLKGVFFVETCNVAHHGLEEMGRIAENLYGLGHDVQMHLHPVWMIYKDKTWPINDSCSDYPEEKLLEIIYFSVESYKAWLGEMPVCVRTGSLKVGPKLYPALNKSGIPISSSIGVAISKPDDKFMLYGGIKVLDGVLELPLTTIEAELFGKKSQRTLQLLSCSFEEIKTALNEAEKYGTKIVNILSHPFEFVRPKDYRYREYIPNPWVRQRFERLCKYLSDNSDRFRVVTVKQVNREKEQYIDRVAPLHKPLKIPGRLVLNRMIENRLSDFYLDCKLLVN